MMDGGRKTPLDGVGMFRADARDKDALSGLVQPACDGEDLGRGLAPAEDHLREALAALPREQCVGAGVVVEPLRGRVPAEGPADGAGTSTVTLSVSSSTRGSSAATASPARLNHLATVASVTDSPSVGTLISTAMSFVLSGVARRQAPRASSTSFACSWLWRL